jgi:hypothetical protein
MDPRASHAVSHLEETPHLMEYAREALLKLTARGNNVFV